MFESFLRLTQRSLVLGGCLTAVFWLTTVPFESFAGAHVALHPVFLPGQFLHAAAAGTTALGLIGLYLPIAERCGWTGLGGFLLSFLGALCFFADALIALVAFPPMAVHAPALIESTGPLFSGQSFAFFVAFSVIQMFGYGIFAIALWRSQIMPKSGAAMMGVGALLYNLPPMPGLHSVLIVGGLLWGTGVVLLGRRAMHLSPAPGFGFSQGNSL